LAGELFPVALSAGNAKATPGRCIGKPVGWRRDAGDRQAAAVRTLLGQTAWATAMLDAIEKKTLSLNELSLNQKQASSGGNPNASIRDGARTILAKGGDLPNPDRQKVIDALTPLLAKTGDVEKGRLAFKNQLPLECHKHTGEGADIGPDLTGMVTHPKLELLTHIIDPSRSVEGNFRVWTVVTSKGVTYTGMLASETKTTVEIIDAEAKKTIVRRDRIEKLEVSPKSLMPEGFEKQLKETELVDLLEFLTHRGKFLPSLPLDRAATIVVARKGCSSRKNQTISADFSWTGSPRWLAVCRSCWCDPKAKRNVTWF
jgi:putative heme-binding domain-containing protein